MTRHPRLRILTRILALTLLVAMMAPGAALADDLPEVAAQPPTIESAVPYEPLDERISEIHRQVQAAASYPLEARERSESGETWVAFMITPEGMPLGITVSRSSGFATLDRAAEEAVRRAGKFPLVYGRVRIPVRFKLRGE
jgi:TonB family protein